MRAINLMRTAAAVVGAVGFIAAVAGCSSTSASQRWGYDGRVPLYSYMDGYVEDQSRNGPVAPWAAMQGTTPGTPRYSWVTGWKPGDPEWYVFQGPAGPAGPQGPQGPLGPMGAQGPTGAPGFNGTAGVAGAEGAAGAPGRLVLQ